MPEIVSLTRRIEALWAAGWDADVADVDEEQFEALIHELAHNVILGDLTPRITSETARMIRSVPFPQRDFDEILTTAVTIQVLETHYGLCGCGTDAALGSVAGNLRDSWLGDVAQERVIELLNSPRVVDLAQQLTNYIEQLAA